MQNIFKNRFTNIIILVSASLFMKFGLERFMGEENGFWLRCADILLVVIIGVFVLKEIAEVIEETTEILSERTKIASGLLQSLGTAFPDMVMGIVAAVLSLSLLKQNYSLAISFAIIAASTTFGSNIYNVAYAAWCVWRQNLANKKKKSVFMLPGLKKMGMVAPMEKHKIKPSLPEIDESLDVLNILSILSALVVLSMVIFGKIKNPPSNINGDLYQLIMPIGYVILALCILAMYYFRKTKRQRTLGKAIEKEERYYEKKSTFLILTALILSGIAILFAAESMVVAVENFCAITGLPFVIAGALAGVIGCTGEMIVVHNFTVNPKGRIGDALVGVGMDNLVTTMGACIVAIMGGIFLGGNSLILIFVLILTLNTVLIWQISKMKNYFLTVKQ